MRALPHAVAMDEALLPVDIETLMGEIQRYLAAIDVFRAAGCEPRWRGERRPVQIPSKERSR